MKKILRYLFGGVVGVIIYVILAFLANKFFGIGMRDFAPYAFAIILGAGMRTITLPASEQVRAIFLAYFITLFPYFLIGCFFTYLIEKIKYKKTFLIIILLLVAVVFTGFVLRNRQINYDNYSQNDCSGATVKGYVARLDKYFNNNQCLYILARRTNDVSLCQQITPNSSQSRDCFIDIAQNLRDASVCDKILDENDKNHCIQDISNQKGECENEQGYGRDNCYYGLSIKIQLLARDNECNFPKVANLINLCNDYKSGKIGKDYFCGKIVDQQLKQNCFNLDKSKMHVDYSNGIMKVTN